MIRWIRDITGKIHQVFDRRQTITEDIVFEKCMADDRTVEQLMKAFTCEVIIKDLTFSQANHFVSPRLTL